MTKSPEIDRDFFDGRLAVDVAVQAAPTTSSVFQEYAPFAWRVLLRLGVAESEVDDLCQEVFVAVHRKLADFEGRSTLRTWLYGICVRIAADHRKRARVRREIPLLDRGSAIEAHQEDHAALRQARGALDRILASLDDRQRAVFVLYEIEELTMAEVAAAVGCPLQTAYSRLHTARRKVEAAVARLQTVGRAP